MTEFVVGETVLVDEALSPYEAMHAFFQVAEERGHAGTSVVVDQDGRVITHPAYSDRMGVAHFRSGLWAFSRMQRAEALGLPTGTDWVRDHALALMFHDGSPYLSVPHSYFQLYLQRFDDSQTHLMAPMSLAGPVAFSSDGSRVCVLEERLGHLADGMRMATFVLWEYELTVGKRRLIAGFTDRAKLGFVELSYSHDGAYILLCDGVGGRNTLVRVADGFIVTLPIVSTAVSWNPRNGPSALVFMMTDSTSGALNVFDFDLSKAKAELRVQIRPVQGLPVEVRELSMSITERALVTANIGLPGADLLARGGVRVASCVDIDAGTITPTHPVTFTTKNAQRRHHSPRWCDDVAALTRSPTVVSEQLLDTGAPATIGPDSPVISRDLVERWSETLDGILTAWEGARIPASAFAQDFAQYVKSVGELDATATTAPLARLNTLARRQPAARNVESWVRTGHRLWFHALDTPGDVHEAETGDVVLDTAAAAAIDELIESNMIADIFAATQALAEAARRSGRTEDQTWAWLADVGAYAVQRREYGLTVRVALAAWRWNTRHVSADRAVASYGVRHATPTEAVAIFTSGFEASTHLPERMVLGRLPDRIVDVADVRNICQHALSRLPLVEHLRDSYRRREGTSGVTVVDPRLDQPILASGPPFISYLHEDADRVGRIVAGLASGDIQVWIDKESLRATDIWKGEIRRAIRACSKFVACFSASYGSRTQTYMDEEIQLALSEMQLLGHPRSWFVPIMLDAARIPTIRVTAVEMLADLHIVDFSAGWTNALDDLTRALRA